VTRKLSTAEASRILGLPEARVREWVRAGLGRPAHRGHRYAISFQDLVVLRAARALLDDRVPAARVRRALAALARQLPSHRPLSGLRLVADGREVAVSDGRRTWQPETGQYVFELGDAALARQVEAVRTRPAAEPDAETDAVRARRAFEEGLDLEDDAPPAAADCYARALALDAELVDAYVNLGRLRHDAGDAGEAARLYELALQRSPEDPVIHFNLALACEDTKGSETAVRHYQRAIELDPDFADAHYNLAGLYEQLGRGAQALRHYRAYQKLTRS
jgi:tetratricopeptide (TPR) repeat protein